jgi:hypothetical protein
MRGNEGRRADAHSYIHPLFCQAYSQGYCTSCTAYIVPRLPPRAENKSGWLWFYIGRFPPALAQNLHNPPADGKQGLIPEEMYQTLLTNKKQGILD